MTARIAICACLVVALLMAMSASAHAARYEGHAVDDPRVSISFDRERGKIRNFTIRRARFSCTDGDRFRAGTELGTMRIRKKADGRRVFGGRFVSEDETQEGETRGRFGRSGVARGTFRLIAVFERVGCYTRRVEWTATRAE